ncbi:hypothetical protein D9615_006359 [Tricholomella constricta]|uniref:Uncharacterized protein n=1 Tax=Tricholomella constricta TaxID=117010 RepID=A0A8H5M1G9_9AGAR|nr:hypothetical protein D9615_006359 [Tricholomella constricta]
MNGSGIACASLPNGAPETTQYLPLEEVRAKVLIVDQSARITLSQTYSNPLDTTTSRCKYMFPVPASAAICAFRMKTSDDRIVNGVVKEKETAQEEFDKAVRDGQFAGLVNYVTDDVFTISIGAIPAHATVDVHLEYVMSLDNDDNTDEVRFQLSKGVGERYGTTPLELTSAIRPAASTRIRITCEIQTSGRIQEIVSPSHHDEITEKRYPTDQGRESRRRSTIKYRSRSFLERDFVLIIRAQGLDLPRCFAELREDSAGRHPTLAMQLTLVPNFPLPPISSQEYLFVIDRSGSMAGDRIATAKETLNLLLRMLPSQGTLFNVFIFDNLVSGLWRQSLEYHETSLRDATAFVDSIRVNGGTEIGNALRYVLRSRTGQLPTAVFVLTDGEAYGDDAIVVVEDAVKQSSVNAPLRVFTLGIGSGISTATCDGIARAGNGASLYAIDTESILGKCARLFNAGRTPFVCDVTIDWGLSHDQLGTQTVTFSNQTLSSRTVATLPPPVIQQAPAQIHNVHAGTRMNIYTIITLKKSRVPKEVVLRGELANGGGPFERAIGVHMVHLVGTNQGLPLIHTLAAWRLIQEHEEKRAPLPTAILPDDDEEIRKAVIIRLGKEYQLISQHTSFVAVDSGQNDLQRSRRRGGRGGSPRRQEQSLTTPSTSLGLFQSALSALSGLLGLGATAILDENQTLPGSWLDSPPLSPALSEDGEDEDEDEDGEDRVDDAVESDESAESHETFLTMTSLESCACSDWSPLPSPPPELSEEEERRQNQPSPRIRPWDLAPEEERQAQSRSQNALQVPAPRLVPAAPPKVVDLMRLQSFDGSFQLDDSLRGIVGSSAVDEVNNLNVKAKVWATALSVAFMQKQMGHQKELLKDLLVKALEYLAKTAEVDVEELIRQARQMLV